MLFFPLSRIHPLHVGLPVQFLSAQLLLFCWQHLLFFQSVSRAEQAAVEFKQLAESCCCLIQIQNDGE